ncbi:MAG: hypothetical protein Q9186_006399 [Xanthomendoza sp. 1 TL-2023]
MDIQRDSSESQASEETVGKRGESEETIVGERTGSELIYITDSMENATTELQRSTQNLAANLMYKPLTLDAEIEHTVQELLVKMAEMLNTLNKEKADIEKALEAAEQSGSFDVSPFKREDVVSADWELLSVSNLSITNGIGADKPLMEVFIYSPDSEVLREATQGSC